MRDPDDVQRIGWLEGRVTMLESFNASLNGQIKALRKERLALKRQLRKKPSKKCLRCGAGAEWLE